MGDVRKHEADLPAIAAAFRVLGALFYRAPGEAGMAQLRACLARGDLVKEWPWGSDEELSAITAGFAAPSGAPGGDDAIARAHQRLFIGPDALAAPPWGSVYRDEEATLFGESTERLASFCRAHGIELASGQREPPDHFGIVCSMLAVAAADGRPALMRTLLAEHLLPWSGEYLARFAEAACDSPFYRACAALAVLSLARLRDEWASEAVAP